MGTPLISWLLNLDLPIHHMQPHRGEGEKKCKRAKEELYLIHMQQQCFLSLSLSHTHTFPLPSNQCFFSNFSCLKFGENSPKLVDFTLEKKAIKKFPNFFVEISAENKYTASNVQQGVSLTVAFAIYIKRYLKAKEEL
jgi:hypothetical protein